MITDVARRWYEVRFYYFITDIYNIRHNTLDLIETVENICVLGSVDKHIIKKVMYNMLNESYYRPLKREVVILGYKIGLQQADLANRLHITRQAAHKYIKENIDTFVAIPRCVPDEDNEIKKFIDTVEMIKQAGI